MFIHFRCMKCHAETEAVEISFIKWPTVQIDRSLRCGHRFFECRLTETDPTSMTANDGLVAQQKGS